MVRENAGHANPGRTNRPERPKGTTVTKLQQSQGAERAPLALRLLRSHERSRQEGAGAAGQQQAEPFVGRGVDVRKPGSEFPSQRKRGRGLMCQSAG